MKQSIGPRLDTAKARLLKPDPVVTYDDLWILFKPGYEVYYPLGYDRAGSTFAAGIVIEADPRMPSRADRRDGKNEFTNVAFWGLESNGITMSRDEMSRSIEKYEGERHVMSLPIYPSRYQDNKDGGKTRRYMEERGERLYKLIHAQPRQMWHDGYCFSSKKPKVRLPCLSQPLSSYKDSTEVPQS